MNIKKKLPTKAYLKPTNKVLVSGYSKANDISKSSAVNIMVRDFFSKLPDNQRAYYLNIGMNSDSY